MNIKSIERVVLPVDLEDPAPDALETALEIAGDPKGVHALYVLPMLEPNLMARIDDTKRLKNARESLRRWLDECGAPDTVRTHVKVGDAAMVTDTLCSAVHAQLVVIHSHGRTGIRRALLGSVAERIARFAPCPVLLLKPPED